MSIAFDLFSMSASRLARSSAAVLGFNTHYSIRGAGREKTSPLGDETLPSVAAIVYIS